MSNTPDWHPEFTEEPCRYYGLTPEEQAEDEECTRQADAAAQNPKFIETAKNMSPEARKYALRRLAGVSERFMSEDVVNFDDNFDREITDVLKEEGEQDG